MCRRSDCLCLFGNTTSKKVTPSVGGEQEYFLVDAEKFLQKRFDLYRTYSILCHAARQQELDDHYFGLIGKELLLLCVMLTLSCGKVGVSSKTQHNEVAPAHT